MKKTLLITNFFPPAIGGIENYYDNFCRRLEPSQIVVLTGYNSQGPAFDATAKYKIIWTDFFDGRFPPRWRTLKSKVRAIIKQEGIEQIIFGHFHPYCLLGRRFGLPYYIMAHGTDITQIKSNWWQKRALRRAYFSPLCRRIIPNSEFLSGEIVRLINDQSKVEKVYPGLDFDGLNQPIGDFASKKQLLGLDDNDIIMLSIGRVEPEKNYEAVIKMIPELLSKIPQLKYVIVGDGSDLERLKALVQNFGLRYNVIFTGAVAGDSINKAFYYQLGHLFVTVSLKPEGFGISYLEAQATKNAVIASKFGGSIEAVKDGETGLLVNPFKPAEIKDAIYRLATDRELWSKMTAAGQAYAKDFDWKIQMDKLNKIFEQS